MLARYEEQTYLLMNVSSKGNDPLWYYAADSFKQLLPNILELDIWDEVIELLEKLLIPGEELLSSLRRNNLDVMLKAAETVDISLVELIKVHIMPFSVTLSEDFQTRLINLLD